MNRCLDFEGNLIPGCEVNDSENGKLDLSTVLFNPKAGDCDFKKSLEQKDGCALYDDFHLFIYAYCADISEPFR